jgi:very-short-patch-repair endonuclease
MKRFHPFTKTLADWNTDLNPYGVTVLSRERDAEGKYPCRCDEGHEFTRVYLGNKTGCPKCAKIDRFSNVHRRLMGWLERKGVDAHANYRKLIPPKEVDAFIPAKSLVIEIDGVYWHSSRFMKNESTERLIRRKLIEDQNIRLLRFWDFEFKNPHAVLSYLSSVLGLSTKRIGARSCVIQEISNEVSAEFLNKWHLQGNTTASVRFGLFFEDKLLAVMTFRKPSISKSYDWELARFAVRGNWSIPGGASRLLSAFRRSHTGSLVSYADRRYSDGGMYRALGFELAHVSKPGYFYYHGKYKVVSRYAAQKHKLEKLLGESFDSAKSEKDNMEANNFYRVYDCGQFVYVLGQELDGQVGRIPYVELPEQKRRTKLTVAEIRKLLPEKLELVTNFPDTEPIVKDWYLSFRCRKCGHAWDSLVYGVLRNRAGGCPKCANRTDTSSIDENLKKNNPHVRYISGFKGLNHKATFEFIPLKFVFEAQAQAVIMEGRIPRPVRSELNKLEPKKRKQILEKLGKYERA